MEKIYAFLIFFIILIIYCCFSRRFLNVGVYLLFAYTFSFLGAVFLPSDEINFTLEASAYLVLVLLFFITPALAVNSSGLKEVRQVDPVLFKVAAYALIITGLFSIFYFLPIVIKIFSSGESFVVLRTDMVGGESYYNVGVYYYIATLASQFYPVAIIFYFYSKLFTGNSGAFNALLLISSSSYIFNVLASVGRDGFVLWSMSFVFGFILFRNFMTEPHLKYFKRIGFSAAVVFLAIFIPITFSRFLILGGVDAVFLSLLSYSSQQLMYFNEAYNSGFDFPFEPSRIVPFLDVVLGVKRESVDFLEYNREFNSSYGIDINTFKTFVGDFYVYLGRGATVVLGLFFCIIGFFASINKGVVSLEKLIFVTLVCQIPLHGLFYYKLGYAISNIYMLMVLAIVLFISFSRLFSNRYKR